ncbi:hypothetical protein FRX31_025194, partial [Thalictrum thalictroides]
MEKKMHHANQLVLKYSKDQGGLGMVDPKAWNKAAYCGLVFKVASNHESLWAKWIREYKLKN